MLAPTHIRAIFTFSAALILILCGITTTANAKEQDQIAHDRGLEHADLAGTLFVEPGIHNLGYTRDGNMLIAIDDQAEVDALYPGCRRMAVGADPHRQFCKKPIRPLTPDTAPTGPVLGEDEPDYVPTPFDAAYSVAFSVKPQPARLNIQPSKGWALKDIPTIFYVSNTEQTTSVPSFLGDATLTWQVSRHVFDYGDNTGVESFSDGGKPYPDHSITHVYTETLDFFPKVTTVWNAEVTVAGRVFVFEGAAVTEDSQKLEIWERKVQLIEPGNNH